MDNLNRIQKTSKALYVLYTGLLILVPLAVAYYWATFNGTELPLPRAVLTQEAGGSLLSSQPYSAGSLMLGFLVTMIPAAVLMVGLFQLRSLFQLYAAGKIFSAENYNCLKNISIALLAWAPARMLFDALVSLVLTFNNPEGQRMISVSFMERELTALFLGLIFLVVAWVMSEACKLQEDNARFV